MNLRGDGKKGGKKGEVSDLLQNGDGYKILKKRNGAHRGPLDFIEIWACEVFQDKAFVKEWQQLVDPEGHFLGFEEWTVNPETRKVGQPSVYPGSYKPPVRSGLFVPCFR